MRFSFFLSSMGGSPLQVGLERGLRELGHTVRCFENGDGRDFDVLVVFNQTAHTQRYAYPGFPSYDVPIAFVDAAEYGYFRRLPGVVKNYANAFAPGSMTHDTKNTHEQTRLKNYLEGKSFPYFLREFSVYLDFPQNYHPIDYPLYKLSELSDRPSKVDYLGRLDGLFLSWGASHPWRLGITAALRGVNAPMPVDVRVLEENGTPRMPQSTYFNHLVRCRASASFDGYGSGSFRMTETLVRTLLLMGPLTIKTHAPLIDGVHCVNYSIASNGEEFVSTDVADKLLAVLADPEWSFRIHKEGHDFCMDYLTEKATAAYFLKTLEAHDWSVPTQLEV